MFAQTTMPSSICLRWRLRMLTMCRFCTTPSSNIQRISSWKVYVKVRNQRVREILESFVPTKFCRVGFAVPFFPFVISGNKWKIPKFSETYRFCWFLTLRLIESVGGLLGAVGGDHLYRALEFQFAQRKRLEFVFSGTWGIVFGVEF